jgi:hypothetical protein
MKNIVLYCKSYRGDLHRAKVLLESVIKYNADSIPFYISVPKADTSIFKNELGTSGYVLIEDESIIVHNQGENWNTQQIVKSSFWKLGISENYVCIDSDCYAIRPFYIKDFIVEGTEDTPYTVMHEQKDLFIWTCNKSSQLGFDPYESFKECRQKVMDIFDRKGRYYDFGPGPIIWSSKVWKSLEDNYLVPNNLTFTDLIKTVPSEFTWSGEWLLTDKTIPLHPCEPLGKFFHYKQQYEEYKRLGYKEEDFAQQYIFLTLQSNWGAPLKY